MPLPNSLSFVTVSSPGTPVPLSSTPFPVAGVRIQPRSAPGTVNVGNVYIGTAGMNKSTGTGVYAVLSPEQVDPETLGGLGGLVDLAQVFVDADNASDGVLVGYFK